MAHLVVLHSLLESAMPWAVDVGAGVINIAFERPKDADDFQGYWSGMYVERSHATGSAALQIPPKGHSARQR